MTNILLWRKYTNSLFGIDEVVKNLLVKYILPIAKTGWEVGGQVYVYKVGSYEQTTNHVLTKCHRQIFQQLPNELATMEIKTELGILES